MFISVLFAISVSTITLEDDVEDDGTVGVVIPRLGQALASFTVVESCVSVGDRVSRDAELILLESEKSVHPLCAPRDGYVVDILVARGDRVSAGEVAIVLGDGLSSQKQKKRDSSGNAWWQVRPMLAGDFESCWSVWWEHQQLAIDEKPVSAERVRPKFDAMLTSLHPPFGAFVAEHEGKIEGWAMIAPFESHPIMAVKSGVISLYVSNPSSQSTPGPLLLRVLIEHAKGAEMLSLVGLTSDGNTVSHSLLSGSGFSRVVNLTRENWLLWEYRL